MPKLRDLTGCKFGRLTVIERHGSNKHGKATWLCQCECGNIVIVVSRELIDGKTKSCGCLRKESESKAFYQDLVGRKFGRLTVIERAGSTKAKKALWKCKCDCGNISFVTSSDLKNNIIKSCGCYGKEMRNKANTTHGDKNKRLYRIWAAMKTRCNNEKVPGYENYGGRGIRICDEWKNNYSCFKTWALENGYAEDLTIDRIDVNGNYEPNNCRWATKQEQAQNTRANIFITINDEKKTLTEWGRIYNIKFETLKGRYHSGWDLEHLFDPPKKTQKKLNVCKQA